MKKTFSNRYLAGEYKGTSIDKNKKLANRLVSIDGKYRTVQTIAGEMLTLIGKREWDSWCKDHDYVTDF